MEDGLLDTLSLLTTVVAHHPELYKTGFYRKPYATAHQYEYEHIAPYRIIYRSYQFVHLFL